MASRYIAIMLISSSDNFHKTTHLYDVDNIYHGQTVAIEFDF